MRYVAFCFVLAALAMAAFATAQQPTKVQKAEHAEHATEHQMTPEAMAKQMSSMNAMMVKLLGKGDAEYEKRFIDLMIPHHEGAVLMAKDAIQKTDKPELKEMAEKMIRDQEKEIATLKAWRKEWYPNVSQK